MPSHINDHQPEGQQLGKGMIALQKRLDELHDKIDALHAKMDALQDKPEPAPPVALQE